jgi:hypothetical protein
MKFQKLLYLFETLFFFKVSFIPFVFSAEDILSYDVLNESNFRHIETLWNKGTETERDKLRPALYQTQTSVNDKDTYLAAILLCNEYSEKDVKRQEDEKIAISVFLKVAESPYHPCIYHLTHCPMFEKSKTYKDIARRARKNIAQSFDAPNAYDAAYEIWRYSFKYPQDSSIGKEILKKMATHPTHPNAFDAAYILYNCWRDFACEYDAYIAGRSAMTLWLFTKDHPNAEAVSNIFRYGAYEDQELARRYDKWVRDKKLYK